MRKTKKPTEQEKKFGEILVEATDQAFLTLGEKTRTTIYFYLQTKFAIAKHQIPEKVEDFSDALEQIFGRGAPKIQILIMKFLKEKIQASYKWVGPKWLVPDLTFVKYVRLMSLCCEDSKRVGDVEVILDAEEQRQIQRA